MSPSDDGAKVTSPGPESAVKVVRNNDSPPTALLSAPKAPPPDILASSLIVGDMLTIAPGSARTCSPRSSDTTARLNEGWYRIWWRNDGSFHGSGDPTRDDPIAEVIRTGGGIIDTPPRPERSAADPLIPLPSTSPPC